MGDSFTHQDQQRIWDAEHANPYVLLQMDSAAASSGVKLFYEYMRANGLGGVGVEMGCGKGRNVIWLSDQSGIDAMHGLDFSQSAIAEARRRGETHPKAIFHVQDVTARWPLDDESVDFVIDCFATTDIETPLGRSATIAEAFRVLRPGGLLLAYVLSTDDEFHKEMLIKSPAQERNAFFHPTTGKFEKTFDAEELVMLHKDFELLESRRIEKDTEFFGKTYHCKHFWNIYRKP